MTQPMTDEELEAKALADYEEGIARIAAEAQSTEVRLEIDGQVFVYQSAGGTGRDKYLRLVAKQLMRRRIKIEQHLELIRTKDAENG